MITEDRARKILGNKYKHLSDKEIESLLSRTYFLAEMAVNLADNKKFQSRAWIIDSKKGKQDD